MNMSIVRFSNQPVFDVYKQVDRLDLLLNRSDIRLHILDNPM